MGDEHPLTLNSMVTLAFRYVEAGQEQKSSERC